MLNSAQILDLRRRYSVAGLLCACALLAPTFAEAADNSIECTAGAEQIVCEVDAREFLNKEIRSVLNNGWENNLHFNLLIMNSDDDIVGVTYTIVSQRCYIDPFDDPCLALWSGSDSWQTYRDIDGLIAGIGKIRLESVPFENLEEGTYTARLSIELNPITDEQASIIRSWLARSRGGHLVVGKNDCSIFGTFVSVFANVQAGHAEASIRVDAPPFTIGPTSKEEEGEGQ